MKKISLLSIFIFLVLNSIFAVTYDNLYVVGNACSAGWNPDGALVMVQESENIFTWSGPLKKDNGNQERFKLLTARSWTTSLTCNLEKAGHQIITSGGEYDLYIKLETDGKPDNAFQVAETGILCCIPLFHLLIPCFRIKLSFVLILLVKCPVY